MLVWLHAPTVEIQIWLFSCPNGFRKCALVWLPAPTVSKTVRSKAHLPQKSLMKCWLGQLPATTTSGRKKNSDFYLVAKSQDICACLHLFKIFVTYTPKSYEMGGGPPAPTVSGNGNSNIYLILKSQEICACTAMCPIVSR